MGPVIEVRDVHKGFRIPSVRRHTVREHALALFARREFERLQVLDGVSFEVRPGEVFGIMGRNGSGKSTLLKIIAGIYRPDAGEVRVNAPITPILELGVGWNPELNAIDNICLIGTVMGLTLKEIRAATGEILAFADLERFAELEVKHYSSGMMARLAFSVAFMAVRDVLVLDEIYAVGDAEFRARCFQRFQELHAKGHTIVVVSHQPGDIMSFCHRAVLLEGGKMVLEGSGAQVADAYLKLLAGDSIPEEIAKAGGFVLPEPGQ
jgi:ABC-type polysaccharide/polyol phosphate transport system ATPase subunit